MKYKLIAIDLDGTLLTDDKKISKGNKLFLKDLIKDGYEIVIATGRRYWSAKRFVEELNDDLVILANNGNIVRKMSNDEVLMKKYLNVEDFYILVEEGKKKGLYPIIHVDNYEEGYDIIIEQDKENTKYYDYLPNNVDRYKRVEDFLKLESPKVLTVVYVDERKELEKFSSEILNKYPNKYSSNIMQNITFAGALLEVMHPLGSKWLSLEKYAKEKEISKEEIIAIGDDNNDVEMVQKAGLGIAMKNGSDMVKEVADIITEKDNNESGVAYTLKRLLKQAIL